MPLRATAIALAAAPVVALALSATSAEASTADNDAGTDASMVEYAVVDGDDD